MVFELNKWLSHIENVGFPKNISKRKIKPNENDIDKLRNLPLSISIEVPQVILLKAMFSYIHFYIHDE